MLDDGFGDVSIGSPGCTVAAEEGRIGMVFARCGWKAGDEFEKGLLASGSPTEAIGGRMGVPQGYSLKASSSPSALKTDNTLVADPATRFAGCYAPTSTRPSSQFAQHPQMVLSLIALLLVRHGHSVSTTTSRQRYYGTL